MCYGSHTAQQRITAVLPTKSSGREEQNERNKCGKKQTSSKNICSG